MDRAYDDLETLLTNWAIDYEDICCDALLAEFFSIHFDVPVPWPKMPEKVRN